ncbi:MAG TPA: SRPBCC family protein [Gemmatimonadaceae bacterium]|jgi:uncharacterized membrane protein|nr:SRPBCC family protein [Gemmatimonadaceae bacterium]
MGTEITRDTGQAGAWEPRSTSRRDKPTTRRSGGETSTKDAPSHYSETQSTEKDPVTQALGWFSIGLGVAELFAPRATARVIGLNEDEHTTLLRTYGLREIAAGVGILTRPKPTYWMWNRVLGDAIDLASLGKAMRSPENNKTRLTGASLAVLGVMALDVICSVSLTSEALPEGTRDDGSFTLAESSDGSVPLVSVITVNKPVEEVYQFWKNPENFSRFMDQIDSVRITSGRRAHWKVKGPPGLGIEFDAEIVTDTPNELISWESVDSAEIENSGTVRFRPAAGNRGTEIELQMNFKPKGGAVGQRIAKYFSAIPKTQMMNDLRRFKQIIELGEIVKSDATAVKGMHAAQPPQYSELEG